MEYGSGRLLTCGKVLMSGLSFDGFMVKTGLGSWQIDGFAMRPDLDNSGFFDDAPNHAVGFWGVYGVRPLKRRLVLEMYYLGLDRQTGTFERGTGQEVRHRSVGVFWRDR